MELTNVENVRTLAALMEEHGLSGIELQQGEDRLVLSRGTVPAAAPAPVGAPAAPAEVPAPQVAARPAPGADDPGLLKAPLVGNVYLCPAPGKPPFVQVGDIVKKGQVLCIIEAMKVMNEFLAPKSGTVTAAHVENEQLVEYGQPLFTLQ